MTQTTLAKAPWHKPKAERKKMHPNDSRIDAKFNEWAKREGINLNQLKLMEKK